MKKVLILVIVVGMLLGSMSIGAMASPQGQGAIVFTSLLPPGASYPAFGVHNPTPPGTLPPAWHPNLTFPERPGADNPVQPAAMQSWNLHFGERDLPTGVPGTSRGWASHPNSEVTVGDPNTVQRLVPPPGTVPAGSGTTNYAGAVAVPGFSVTNAGLPSDVSLLGVLINEGTTGTTPGPGGVPPGTIDQRPATATFELQIELRQFYVGANRTLQSFELTLDRYRQPGFRNTHPIRGHNAPAPNACTTTDPGTDATPGINVTDSVTLLQNYATPPLGVTNPGPVAAARFQPGFAGIQWSGMLEGIWNGSNITSGNAQAEILFTIVP